MREIIDHRIAFKTANTALSIKATDVPGAGGANCRYEITGFDTRTNPSGDPGNAKLIVLFQQGDPEKAVNGITNEALLAIVLDRLRCFQAGPFACPENGTALANIETGLATLKLRTIERMGRGVEGKQVT